MKLIAVVAFGMLAFPLTAGAGEGCHDPLDVVQNLFDGADLDRNGSLSRSEYDGAGLQEYGVTFEESDANADGETSLVEYLELYERHHRVGGQTEA